MQHAGARAGEQLDSIYFFFSSRRRHTRLQGDWSSDVCSSDLLQARAQNQHAHDAIASGRREGCGGGNLATRAARRNPRVAPGRLDSRPMTQADLTRERLVRAALELFTAQGYHDTTTPAIAKKAGVAEGTIYRHFAGKQQFFNELYRASARWAGKLVKDAYALNVGPREKLAELAPQRLARAARQS